MTLTYTKRFFPLPLVNDAQLPLPQGVAITDFTLPELVQLYWMARSFDWEIDIGYNLFYDDPYGHSKRCEGSLTGSGTVLCETYGTKDRGTGALPAERTPGDSYLPGGALVQSDAATQILTDAGNFTLGDGLGGFFPPVPYSTPQPLIFQWFNRQGLHDGRPVMVTQSGSAYVSRISFGQNNDYFSTPSLVYGNNGGYAGPYAMEAIALPPLGPSSGLNLVLKMTGRADVTVPFYLLSLGATSRAVSGSVTFDFNNFWAA